MLEKNSISPRQFPGRLSDLSINTRRITNAVIQAVTVAVMSNGILFVESCGDRAPAEKVQEAQKKEKPEMSDAALEAYLERHTKIKIGIKKEQDENDKRKRIIFQ